MICRARKLSGLTTIVLTCWLASSFAADAPPSKADEESMSCEQIVAELSPYMQQLMPNIQNLAASQQKIYTQTRAMGEQRKLEHSADAALYAAASLDRSGAMSRAMVAKTIAQHAKEQAENEAFMNSPTVKQGGAQMNTLADQAKEMQSNAQLQRLMQLAREKHCY